MTLRLSTSRDKLSQLGGYCYGSVESKSRFICGFSQKVNLACGHHTTSNSIKASEPALILLPAHSLAQHPTGCKLSFKPLSLNCVKLISSSKNRRSKLDSHQARKYAKMVIVSHPNKDKAPSVDTSTARCDSHAEGGRNVMQLNHTSKLPQRQLQFVPIEIADMYGHHTVQAVILGKLAVHDLQGDQPREGYTVTHLATGYSLASFSCFHVACQYSIDIQGRFDIESLAKKVLAGDKSPEFQQQIDELRRRTLHDTYLFTQYAKERLERLAPVWLATHQENEIIGYKAVVQS